MKDAGLGFRVEGHSQGALQSLLSFSNGDIVTFRNWQRSKRSCSQKNARAQTHYACWCSNIAYSIRLGARVQFCRVDLLFKQVANRFLHKIRLFGHDLVVPSLFLKLLRNHLRPSA